jgi:hypothetical protein
MNTCAATRKGGETNQDNEYVRQDNIKSSAVEDGRRDVLIFSKMLTRLDIFETQHKSVKPKLSNSGYMIFFVYLQDRITKTIAIDHCLGRTSVSLCKNNQGMHKKQGQ